MPTRLLAAGPQRQDHESAPPCLAVRFEQVSAQGVPVLPFGETVSRTAAGCVTCTVVTACWLVRLIIFNSQSAEFEPNYHSSLTTIKRVYPPSEPWLFENGMNDTRIKSAEPLVLIVLRTPSPHAIMDVSSWL